MIALARLSLRRPVLALPPWTAVAVVVAERYGDRVEELYA
jgi:hypothetical protein